MTMLHTMTHGIPLAPVGMVLQHIQFNIGGVATETAGHFRRPVLAPVAHNNDLAGIGLRFQIGQGFRQGGNDPVLFIIGRYDDG